MSCNQETQETPLVPIQSVVNYSSSPESPMNQKGFTSSTQGENPIMEIREFLSETSTAQTVSMPRVKPVDPCLICKATNEIGGVKKKLNVEEDMPSPSPTELEDANIDFVTSIASIEKFFPNLCQQTKDVIKGMTFNERVLLSSATVEQNELYQDAYQRLRAYETEMHINSLSTTVSLVGDTRRFMEDIQSKVYHDQHIPKMQSQLLALRTKRHRLEAVINQVEEANGKRPRSYTSIQKPSTPAIPLSKPEEANRNRDYCFNAIQKPFTPTLSLDQVEETNKNACGSCSVIQKPSTPTFPHSPCFPSWPLW
ncbi:hypothetical protein MJO28_005649 [Puccinia striiformis f. sp. tritici]|uniref:Uncharacterized protein n=1 Tax=Puccinia striiformis f. sp. tritici TaxID=168172 RepID=A0ACC0EM15_9BASI|nr:hypothetical protein MJO28_005649 [Puccinia striiformis f. sp. tritici]